MPFTNDSVDYFLNYTLFSNAVIDYGLALLVFLAALLVFLLARSFFLGKLKKIAKETPTKINETLVRILRSFSPPFYLFLAFYISLSTLEILPQIERVTFYVFISWLTYQIVIAVSILIDLVSRKVLEKEGYSDTESAINLLTKIAKGVVWVVAILTLLSNMGFNVTSFVAGLGVGGVAVALALQNILNDLFSSFSIYFDKPFVVGDFIIIGEKMGVVKDIGIKSTRIQSLQGEEIVISNRELTTAQIQNFKKMEQRRIVFHFGVLYETPHDKLVQIPEMIKKIIENHEMARFDRAHFQEFADSALRFEVVYYMTVPGFNEYMDTQQDINFAIREIFAKEGIEMAYPTRTLYLKGGSGKSA